MSASLSTLRESDVKDTICRVQNEISRSGSRLVAAGLLVLDMQSWHINHLEFEMVSEAL